MATYARDERLAKAEIAPPAVPRPDYEPRIFLAIDAHGRLGPRLSVGGRVRECVAEEPLAPLRWIHVAATFDAGAVPTVAFLTQPVN